MIDTGNPAFDHFIQNVKNAYADTIINPHVPQDTKNVLWVQSLAIDQLLELVESKDRQINQLLPQ